MFEINKRDFIIGDDGRITKEESVAVFGDINKITALTDITNETEAIKNGILSLIYRSGISPLSELNTLSGEWNTFVKVSSDYNIPPTVMVDGKVKEVKLFGNSFEQDDVRVNTLYIIHDDGEFANILPIREINLSELYALSTSLPDWGEYGDRNEFKYLKISQQGTIKVTFSGLTSAIMVVSDGTYTYKAVFDIVNEKFQLTGNGNFMNGDVRKDGDSWYFTIESYDIDIFVEGYNSGVIGDKSIVIIETDTNLDSRYTINESPDADIVKINGKDIVESDETSIQMLTRNMSVNDVGEITLNVGDNLTISQDKLVLTIGGLSYTFTGKQFGDVEAFLDGKTFSDVEAQYNEVSDIVITSRLNTDETDFLAKGVSENDNPLAGVVLKDLDTTLVGLRNEDIGSFSLIDLNKTSVISDETSPIIGLTPIDTLYVKFINTDTGEYTYFEYSQSDGYITNYDGNISPDNTSRLFGDKVNGRIPLYGNETGAYTEQVKPVGERVTELHRFSGTICHTTDKGNYYNPKIGIISNKRDIAYKGVDYAFDIDIDNGDVYVHKNDSGSVRIDTVHLEYADDVVSYSNVVHYITKGVTKEDTTNLTLLKIGFIATYDSGSTNYYWVRLYFDYIGNLVSYSDLPEIDEQYTIVPTISLQYNNYGRFIGKVNYEDETDVYSVSGYDLVAYHPERLQFSLPSGVNVLAAEVIELQGGMERTYLFCSDNKVYELNIGTSCRRVGTIHRKGYIKQDGEFILSGINSFININGLGYSNYREKPNLISDSFGIVSVV